MAEARDACERILGLGREELASIGNRDTERLSAVLRERQEAIAMFLNDEDARQDEAFLEKLGRIREMNAMLGNEARRLHQSLKDELIKLRMENKRISGYRNGAMVTPLTRRVVSRKG
jgi:hypothetical protein